jgi:hypothetical protein
VIGFVIVAFLAFVALVYVTGPLRGRGAPDEEIVLPEVVEQAQESKRQALVAILDMQEERAAGKLAEPDYRVLRSQYEREALDALHRLDAVTMTADAELEAEVARIRAELTCPSCGAFRTAGAQCDACASS